MSREAAAEFSPGRKPGDQSAILTCEPAKRATDGFEEKQIIRPSESSRGLSPLRGFEPLLCVLPRAGARGYFLPALRGSLNNATLKL